jgi:peptidoglycan hydrolase-like protein with peptidoglycan-binding domain
MKTKGKSKPTRQGKPTSTRKTPPSKKKAKSKIILTSLAVGAVGILGYLAWQFYNKRKASRRSSSGNADLMTILPGTTAAAIYPSATSTTVNTAASVPLPKPAVQSTTAKKATSTLSSFPLKKGSKNELVKSLQLALIAKYGAGILPKYGADGDFGSETVAALSKVGLPATIDESTYYVIVQTSSSAVDKSALAGKFITAAEKGDFNTVMSLLKQMRTKEDYKQVNEIFIQYRLRGVRQTLVNGLLGSFTNENQKQQIRYEFIRMGLKYNGSQWSLDGFDGRPIVTTEATNVWISATKNVGVQASVVLGAEVTRKLDYTLFENNGRYFLVATKSIKYL